MPAGVIDTLKLRYVVDVADKATKPLLASERAIQRSTIQTSRALKRQDDAVRRSGTIAASTASRKSRAHERAAVAMRSETQQIARLTRENDKLVASVRRSEQAEKRRQRAAARGPSLARRGATRVGGATAGVLGGFGAVSAGRFVASEYTEAARLQAVIAQGIKTTGGVAKVTAGDVERLSATLSRQAGVDDELIGKGASVLLTFTKIRNEVGAGNKVFDRATRAALDLSVRLGKDLTSTSLQVGKALNDPIKGVTALARAGVQFDEQQKKQIKTMVESGNRLGAQRMILKELETQVGGTARAQAQPIDRLRVSVGNLAESVGTKLAPSVEKAADRTANFIDQMATGTGGGGKFAAQMRELGDDLRPIAKGLKSVGGFLVDHPRLVAAAGGSYVAFKAARGVLRIVGDLRAVSGAIGAVTRRAAKSRIAVLLAEGAAGVAGRMRRALAGVPGAVASVMDRAGRRGAVAMGGGRWAKAGRIAGRGFGVAVGIGALTAIAAAWPSIQKWWEDKAKKLPGPDWLWSAKALGQKLGLSKGKRAGGYIRGYASGGMVPILAAGGEVLVDRGQATMIGGHPRRDATPLMARPGSAVLTSDGQERMMMGASLSEAVRSQAPHFAKGGVVPGRYTSTSYGPPWRGIQGTGVTRTGVNLKNNPRVYGIATDPNLIPLGSRVFAHPNPFGYTGRFSAFDTGGAIKGRRVDFYDWRGRKLQNAWGRRSVTISRGRLAPRGDEDTYRAPGGGGSELAVRVIGASRRRSGILEDAFGQGRSAGQAGLTRGMIRAEGNPVLRAIREAIAGAGTQPDKGGPANKYRAEKLGDRGSFKAGTAIARMHAKAAAIDAKHYQYAWGGGHGRVGVPTVGSRTSRGGTRALGYDCSGGVSAVLAAGGLLKGALTSGSLMGWGKAGSGKRLAVHADASHVIMRIGKRYWGTGEANPGGGAGWLPSNTMKGRGAVRTWPGFRAGGVVGRPLQRGVQRAMTMAGGSLEALDAIIGRSLDARLLALREQITRRVRKGGPAIVISRLQAVISTIDHELGRRVGRIEDAVEKRSAALERARGDVDRLLRARGVSADSMQGLGVMAGVQAAETGVRGQNVRSLQSALRRATQARDRTAVQEITQALQAAQDELQESLVRQIEIARDRIRALGAERINNAGFWTGLAQAGGSFLDVQQRLAQTQDTPGGMMQRAGYLQTGIIPHLQNQARAQIANAQLMASIGDLEGWRSAVQDAASTAVDIANAQADAADLIREAAQKASQSMVDLATHGTTMADLQLQRLELEQRLIGTHESTGGAMGRADFIRQQIMPAIQQEIVALEAQRAVAQQQGNADLVRQLNETIFGRQNDLLQRNLDANEQTASNTDALKEFGGSTAFSYQGQIQTDLDVIRARAGA